MEIFVDRRRDNYARVPLHASMIVEFEGLSEPIAAECVDLSGGGVALRTPLLPDEGTKVFCSFESVAEASDFGAWGKVVWVQNQGRRSSEFGVCFENLDPEVEARIAQLLTPRAISIESRPNALCRPTTVKLFLDGSSAPVETYLVERRGEQMVLGQDLELLRIERGLLAYESPEQGCRGRVESVDLRLDGRLPRLFIAVRLDPVGCEQPVRQIIEPQASLEPDEREENQESKAGEVEWQIGTEPVVEPRNDGRQSQPCAPKPPSNTKTYQPKRSDDHSTLFTLPEDGFKDEGLEHILCDTRNIASTPIAAAFKWLIAAAAALCLCLKRLAVLLADKTAEWMSGRGIKYFYRALRRLQEAFAALFNATARRVVALRLFKRKRRTTAAPSLLGNRGKGTPKGERFDLLRVLFFPALAIAGIALAFYGFGPWTRVDGIPLHRPVRVEQSNHKPAVFPRDEGSARIDLTGESRAQASGTEVANAPDTAPTPPGLNGTTTPTPGASTGAVTPEGVNQKRSLRAEAKAGGPAATSDTASSESPPKKPLFGSARPVSGKIYTLRMSKEITQLQGIPDKGGFTVIIPGTLSYDRAGPIAAAHPLVDSSMILNKGDHAALTIRFSRGKTPAYRVAAKGNSLEITIAESS